MGHHRSMGLHMVSRGLGCPRTPTPLLVGLSAWGIPSTPLPDLPLPTYPLIYTHISMYTIYE